MEGVLEAYARPYDAQQPVQLVREIRTPVEATAEHPRGDGAVAADESGLGRGSRGLAGV